MVLSTTDARQLTIAVATSFVLGIVVAVAITVHWGMPRLFTGIIAGIVVALAVIEIQRRSRATVIDDSGILFRSVLRRNWISWQQVDSITIEDDAETGWLVSVKYHSGEAALSEPVLRLPEVRGPLSGAYDYNKREALVNLLGYADDAGVPVDVPAPIAAKLVRHWKLTLS